MHQRHIMIGTPVREGLGIGFVPGLLDALLNKHDGLKLDFVMLGGPSVNFARNELAQHAVDIGADELLFVDADMGWTLTMFERMISDLLADLDVVGGIYCKKKGGKPIWLLKLLEGEKPDPETGLARAEHIATGFMKIKTRVFRKIAADRPDLEFYLKPEDNSPKTSFEWFPMGVIGPRTHEARLAKVREALKRLDDTHDCRAEHLQGILDEIVVELETPHQPGNLYGEDYNFSRLARASGFTVWADFGMPIIPHIGAVQYPITPERVGVDPSKPVEFTP